MTQEFLTIKEYAAKTGISESTLYRNFRKGNLPNAVKIGGVIRIIDWIDDKPSEFLIQNKEGITQAIRQVRNGCNVLLDIIENI